MSAALIIFIKNLSQGKVKTRLAKQVGEVNALKIYQHLLYKTMENTIDLDVDKYIYYDEHVPTNDEWSASAYSKRIQEGEHFGIKINNALQNLFEVEEYKKVVFIQPDCPKLTQNFINSAFKHLDSADIVVGPTDDNGYYLLGMKGFYPEIFNNSSYETATKYDFISQNMNQLNKTIHILPEMKDIDLESDLGDLKIQLKIS